MEFKYIGRTSQILEECERHPELNLLEDIKGIARRMKKEDSLDDEAHRVVEDLITFGKIDFSKSGVWYFLPFYKGLCSIPFSEIGIDSPSNAKEIYDNLTPFGFAKLLKYFFEDFAYSNHQGNNPIENWYFAQDRMAEGIRDLRNSGLN